MTDLANPDNAKNAEMIKDKEDKEKEETKYKEDKDNHDFAVSKKNAFDKAVKDVQPKIDEAQKEFDRVVALLDYSTEQAALKKADEAFEPYEEKFVAESVKLYAAIVAADEAKKTMDSDDVKVLKLIKALRYGDASEKATYAGLRANWDVAGQLETCTDPAHAGAEHTCPVTTGEGMQSCGRISLMKTVESGDPVSKRYDHVCLLASECGT